MIVTAVRHAESLGNIGATTDPDPALSPKGEKQARLTAKRLAAEGVTHIWSSPYRRAILTILPLAERIGLDIVITGDMLEHHLYDNLEDFRFRPGAEIAAEFAPARMPQGAPDEIPVPEWPETWEHLLDRTAAVARAALELGGDSHLVIVGHGASVKGLVTALTGTAIEQHAGFVNCSASRVTLDGSLPGTTEFINDASHLDSLKE